MRRRRLVVGMREVHRGVRARKLRCVIMAPNNDEGAAAGGLDERVRDGRSGAHARGPAGARRNARARR